VKMGGPRTSAWPPPWAPRYLCCGDASGEGVGGWELGELASYIGTVSARQPTPYLSIARRVSNGDRVGCRHLDFM